MKTLEEINEEYRETIDFDVKEPAGVDIDD
ncbi:hypothetical protein SRABI96_04809 [Peribacillus sp. Bi96]|nr:hypothetical protein SRABI96_04809 [Peribacillus sp. Bi96]